jgi:hypothetical protein
VDDVGELAVRLHAENRVGDQKEMSSRPSSS